MGHCFEWATVARGHAFEIRGFSEPKSAPTRACNTIAQISIGCSKAQTARIYGEEIPFKISWIHHPDSTPVPFG